jgi:uncharacterized protein
METMRDDAPLQGLSPELQAKAARLFGLFAEMDSALVAFSGGVDSGLLCAVGARMLGHRLTAATVQSPVESPGDTEAAEALAQQVGFRHQIISFDDLQQHPFVENPPDRCYHCKLARFQHIQSMASAGALEGVNEKTVFLEGSNADDALDYRPGARAVQELGIRSPLAEAGLTKADVRALAKALGLRLWDRPSSPCLATRFPYGSPITREGLVQVARGERFLREVGFQPVRVRHDDKTARLEVPAEQIPALAQRRAEVLAFFKELGYTYVMVDLAGYRMGSMNEVLGA